MPNARGPNRARVSNTNQEIKKNFFPFINRITIKRKIAREIIIIAMGELGGVG